MGIALVPEPLEQVHIPGLIYHQAGRNPIWPPTDAGEPRRRNNGAACTFLAMAREGMDSDKAIG